MKSDFIFTSESVTEGHPDKLCDQISDAIVDQFLRQDPYSKISAECAVATGVVFIAARYASKARVDIPEVARQVIQQVGYVDSEFDAKDCTILTNITELPQSEYRAIDERELSNTELDKLTAKNQVTTFGFACHQTNAYMPLPIWLAHRLARRLTAVRLEKKLAYLLPDGMTQVGIEFHHSKPERIFSITLVASQQATSKVGLDELREDLRENVIRPVLQSEPLSSSTDAQVFINPDGPLLGGGPAAHAGLTGRKNAVDLYGQYSRRSGAALSGKDPSRIDRIGAYAARYAAKNIIAAGLADECEVQLSYSIGNARPVSVQVETFGTGAVSDGEIAGRLESVFDFRPGAIVAQFNLRHLPATIKGGFYRKLAAYGHVGRMDVGLPWENTDKAAALV
jgi:S-adenosylmethionine synthetase